MTMIFSEFGQTQSKSSFCHLKSVTIYLNESFQNPCQPETPQSWTTSQKLNNRILLLEIKIFTEKNDKQFMKERPSREGRVVLRYKSTKWQKLLPHSEFQFS